MILSQVAEHLALNIQLGNCWRLGEFLDMLTQVLIIQNIYVFELLDAVEFQDLNQKVRLVTPGHFTCTIHEDANVVVVYRILD